MIDTEHLIGVPELAARLGVPRSWVYSQTAAGILPAVRIGKYVKFRPTEIDRWIEQRRTGSAPAPVRAERHG